MGEFWSYPQSRAFAELLIDCEEDRTLRAGLSGCCERLRGDSGDGIAMGTATATFVYRLRRARTLTSKRPRLNYSRSGGLSSQIDPREDRL